MKQNHFRTRVKTQKKGKQNLNPKFKPKTIIGMFIIRQLFRLAQLINGVGSK